MLPGILKRMQCKREAATDNPIKYLHQRNSRISVHADGLPKYTGSIITKEWMKKKSYSVCTFRPVNFRMTRNTNHMTIPKLMQVDITELGLSTCVPKFQIPKLTVLQVIIADL